LPSARPDALGAEVRQVFAYANHKAEPMLPIDDCYVTALQFDNGVVGKLIAAAGNRGYAPTGGHLALYGTEGTLWGRKLYRYDEAAQPDAWLDTYVRETGLPRMTENSVATPEAFRAEIATIRQQGLPGTTLQAHWEAMRVAQRAVVSACRRAPPTCTCPTTTWPVTWHSIPRS
jgi:predicted dehydrogenase